MQDHTNTRWHWSVTGVAIRDNCVLLARHTYGGGKGKWIVPGGYLEGGELPTSALCREFQEETGVTVEVGDMIGIRCGEKNWYMAFRVTWLSGEARSDGDENDAVEWMPIPEALEREDVPILTKTLIRAALTGEGLGRTTDYYNGELWSASRE